MKSIPHADKTINKSLRTVNSAFYILHFSYDQSCPSAAAMTANLKQRLTLMTEGQSCKSEMITSAVFWPA